jgi:hypothetical protein
VTEQDRKKHLRTYAWMSVSFASALLAIGGWLLFIPKPVVVSEPIFLTRDGMSWTQHGVVPVSPYAWTERNGELVWQNQMGAVASYSSGVAEYSQLKHIVVLNQSDESLAQQVGPILANHLKAIPTLQRIDYFPYDRFPEAGEEIPDYYVTLRTSGVQQQNGMAAVSTEARIRCLVSRALTQSNFTDSGEATVPRFRYHGKFDLRFSGTQSGLTSCSAKYKLESQKIGAALAEAISKALVEVHKENGLTVVPPEQLYPAFEAAAPLPALGNLRTTEIIAGRGLMTKNETIWRIEDDKPFHELVAELQHSLPSENWKISYFSDDQLHARRGTETLLIGQFQEREPIPLNRLTVTLPGSPHAVAPLDPEAEHGPTYVHYRNRMGVDEVNGIVDAFLETDQSLDRILPLICQRFPRRLGNLLETKKCSSAKSWFAIANICSGLKMPEQAKMALKNAHIAVELEHGDTSDLRQKIQVWSKKLGVDLGSSLPATTDDYVAAGARLVPLDLAEPLLLNLEGEQNSLLTLATEPPHFVAVRVVRLEDGEIGTQLSYRHEGTTVESPRRLTGSPLKIPLGQDDKVLVLQVTPVDNSRQRFELTVSIKNKD